MDVREIAIERWISPLPAEKEGEGEEAGDLCVLSKHVEHLSLLFYGNEKKDKLFAPPPPFFLHTLTHHTHFFLLPPLSSP